MECNAKERMYAKCRTHKIQRLSWGGAMMNNSAIPEIRIESLDVPKDEPDELHLYETATPYTKKREHALPLSIIAAALILITVSLALHTSLFAMAVNQLRTVSRDIQQNRSRKMQVQTIQIIRTSPMIILLLRPRIQKTGQAAKPLPPVIKSGTKIFLQMQKTVFP